MITTAQIDRLTEKIVKRLDGFLDSSDPITVLQAVGALQSLGILNADG